MLLRDVCLMGALLLFGIGVVAVSAQEMPMLTPPPGMGIDANAKDALSLNFPGGTVRDLAVYLQGVTGEAIAVTGAVDRDVRAFQFPVPKGEMLRRIVGGMAQVAFRPGYLLAPLERPNPEQPTDFALASRELEEKRDLTEVGPLKQDAVVLATALKQLSDTMVMPILIEGTAPPAPLSIDLPKLPVHEVIAKLAEQCKLQAKPVQVMFGLTADNLEEAMKFVTDEEMAEEFNARMDMFSAMPPDMLQTAVQWMYGEYRKLSDMERAGMMQFMGKFMGVLQNRFAGIQGAEGDRLRGGLRDMAQFGLQFYGNLPPGERTELQPLAEEFLGIIGK